MLVSYCNYFAFFWTNWVFFRCYQRAGQMVFLSRARRTKTISRQSTWSPTIFGLNFPYLSLRQMFWNKRNARTWNSAFSGVRRLNWLQKLSGDFPSLQTNDTNFASLPIVRVCCFHKIHCGLCHAASPQIVSWRKHAHTCTIDFHKRTQCRKTAVFSWGLGVPTCPFSSITYKLWLSAFTAGRTRRPRMTGRWIF